MIRPWKDQPLWRKGLVSFSVPLLTLLVALGALLWVNRREVVAENEVRRTLSVQTEVQDVSVQLERAATGVRGYLLTHDGRFLEPYTAARGRLKDTLGRLDHLIADRQQRARLEQIKPLAERELTGLRALLAPGITRAETTRRLLDNKAVLDLLRADLAIMTGRESELVTDRIEAANRIRADRVTLIFGAGVLGLLGSVLAVLLFSSGIVRRVQALEQDAGRLERGEPLHGLPAGHSASHSTAGPAADDEIGRLASALQGASTLLAGRETALRTATEEAERASHAKSMFLSRMSHELRTPLNAILGFAQLLELSAAGQRQARQAGQIVKAGRHLLGLINEILDFNRIEAGRLILTLEDVALDDLTGEITEMVTPLADARDVSLKPLERGGLSVLADRQRLAQVLLNLLDHAVKYNHPGGSVSVLTEAAPDGQVILSVQDDGPGLSPTQLSQLFVPFERLGAEESGTEGSGLGLSLCQRLVHGMNGEISARSTPGVGSVFTVQLPAASRPPYRSLPQEVQP